MITSVIIPAAGSGKRFHSSIPKQFTLLNGIPIIIHTLKLFDNNPTIDSIILAVATEQLEFITSLIKKYSISKVKDIVIGGSERLYSVRAALNTPSVRQSDIVLIHDAVRPFASDSLVNTIIRSASEFGAVIPAMIPKETIKQISDNNTISKTITRSELRSAQTPQGFKREIIINAYSFADTHEIMTTDDASVVEASGGVVYYVDGEDENIKITTPLDFKLAQIIAQNILGN